MPQFYRTHRSELQKNPCTRDLNAAMAVVLLHLFERKPEHWEAVRWLNATQRPEGESFAHYLTRWYDAVPERHKPFVRRIAELYDVSIETDAP